MNGFHTDLRRRFPPNRHPVDVFGGGILGSEDPEDEGIPFAESLPHTYASPRVEYRSGRSSVPAPLLQRLQQPTGFPSPQQQQQHSTVTLGRNGHPNYQGQPAPPPRNFFSESADFERRRDNGPSSQVFWRQQPSHDQFRSIADQGSRLIDDLLAPYAQESPVRVSATPQPSQQHPSSQQAAGFRNPQPYYPYRRPTSALADPFAISNAPTNPPKRLDPLRQQNREQIHVTPLHIRNPFVAHPEERQEPPRPTHRTFSEPAHTLDILSTSLYDPSSPYYANRHEDQDFSPLHNNNNYHPVNNNHLDNVNGNDVFGHHHTNGYSRSAFSDTDDWLDDDMSKTTANWKNSFAQMRDRFGAREQTPNLDNGEHLPYAHDFSFVSDGSLTMPRSRGLLKSSSQNTVNHVNHLEPSRSSSLLRHAVDRRASETPEPNGFFDRRNSDNGERRLGSFWMETVRNRPASPSITRIPFKMTTAAERLEQLQEPLDGPVSANGFPNGDNVSTKREAFLQSNNTNGFSSTSKPFPSERFVSERKMASSPNFSSLDHAVADLRQNTEKLVDSRGCARFPVDELAAFTSQVMKGRAVFTGNRSSPPSASPLPVRTQHSPSPDSLSGESTTSLAHLPHPRPKHNIREQLLNAGVGNTFLGPYLGRRMSPNFPAPNSGSVASRISAFEKRPGTPTLQLACSTSSPLPEAPRSPLSPRTTVFRTKPVIHVDMGRDGAVSPEYDNKRITTVSTSAAFSFPHKNDISYSPRWRDDPTDEASPMARRTPVDSPNTLSQELNRLRIQNPEPFGHSTPVQLRQPPQTHVSPVCKIDFDNLEDSCELSTSHSHSAASVSLTKSLSSVAKVTHSMPPLPSVPVSVAGKLANTPRFHFPTGQPVSKAQNDEILRRVQGIFAARPQLPPSGFDEVCRQMGLPVYTKKAVYEACCQVAHLPPADNPCISFAQFADYWNRMTTGSHDEASRFVFTLSVAKTGLPARTYLTKEDFHSILYDLIETYPGLRFLCDATQFHTRYVEVVIVRIFWNCNRSWSGKLSILELRRSNFLETMHMLEETDEINKITDYFSYEHFYVIYCKFWEIDTKHELILTRDSMRRHCSGALTDRIIDRIFSPAVNRVSQRPVNRRGPVRPEHIETIGFEEFVAFLLAEEDKRHPTAIEYWFRCLDLDGDGVISIYEMELFYNDIVEKIHSKNYETLEFNDVLCQLYDLVSPEEDGKITLRDLKRCGLAHRFFNTFVNYIKHIEQESADGERASVKMNGDKEMSDWDHFCAVEYEMLMAEADQDRNGNDEAYNVDLDDDDELTQEATFGMDSNVVSALSVDDSQY